VIRVLGLPVGVLAGVVLGVAVGVVEGKLIILLGEKFGLLPL